VPSTPQQTIPAAGIIRIQLPTTRKLAVLKITNESARIMFYVDRGGAAGVYYGDPIPANYGSVAYHLVDGDKPPATFYVRGTATDTFAIHYEEL